MTENLAAAASGLNASEALIRRSAEARAKATGSTPEAVLAAWAGGETPPAPAPATEPVTAPIEETASPQAKAPRPSHAATPPPAAASPEPPPTPARVRPEDVLAFPVVVSVPTAGLKERTNTSLPRWLAIAFVIVPVFGLLYMAGDSQGCQEGGFELAANRVTGAVQNCDGSEFEGRGAAGGSGAFLSIGQQLFTTCAACHGANGGGGVGPALATVLNTFSSCDAQIEWVTLGSRGFTAAGNTTYGDLAAPISGGMPAFGRSLTPDQIASVVAFERVRFGGGEPEEVLVECGLVEPAEEAGPESTEPTPVEPGSLEAGAGQ